MNKPTVSRATFQGMATKDKLNVLFDIATENGECLYILEGKVARRQKYDFTAASLFGLVGGFAAQLIQRVFR